MAFLALVDAPLSSESMKFPVFSLLTGNFERDLLPTVLGAQHLASGIVRERAGG